MSKMMERVQALLRKAESTDSEAEAEAFTAKATELIMKHSLDAAIAYDLDQSTDRIGVYMFNYTGQPRAKYRALLAYWVADAMGCKAVLGSKSGIVHIISYEGDMEYIKVLVASLILQCERAMRRTPVVGSPRSWGNAFWMGFIGETNRRLGAQQSANQVAIRKEQSESTALVLQSRQRELSKRMKEEFPHTQQKSTSYSNRSGAYSGVKAGQNADIAGSGSRVGSGGRLALGS